MSTYQWNAEDYKQHSRAQQVWARELITKLNLSGDERVMDLGCGDGKVTVEIAAAVPNGSVMGVDSSAEMIVLAREEYPAARYANIHFQQMDARDLRCDLPYDVVFSNAALHWVKDHQPVMAGFARCVCPGGRILLQMGGEGNAVQILDAVHEVMKWPQWREYFRDFQFPYGFYGVADYEALLQAHDFRARRVELIDKDMQHKGMDGLEGWIRTTWMPYTELVPETIRGQFIRDIATHYIERVPMDGRGVVHIAMVRIEVDAQKL